MTGESPDSRSACADKDATGKRFTLKVLYLFAGAERKTSVVHYLARLAEKQGWALDAREVDLKRGREV